MEFSGGAVGHITTKLSGKGLTATRFNKLRDAWAANNSKAPSPLSA